MGCGYSEARCDHDNASGKESNIFIESVVEAREDPQTSTAVFFCDSI